MGNYLDKNFDHCADVNGTPLTRTPPRRSWGRGPSPPGWRRLQARRSTCLLLRALQRRRVESLVLGALSSSPVHRALVLVLGTSIAVLLGCSKSSRQCSLSYLLTYLLTYCTEGVITHGRYEATNLKQVADMEGNTGPHRWVVLFGKEQCDVKGSGTR
jgi:hypothetical protein